MAGFGPGLGGSKRTEFVSNADINVTPFVDVMLVLLIIFMVAAPLATVNVKVDLPPANAQPTQQDQQPIFVSLQRTGQLFIGDYEISLAMLGTRIVENTQGDREMRIFIRADRDVAYGEVMRVMNVLQDNGYYKLALVAEEVVD